MKYLKYLLIGIPFLFAFVANAQVPVTLNLDSHPQWGPAGFSNIRYYYLPDVKCYYDIQSSKFIYHNGISWVHKSHLPFEHRNYDLFRGYKVVMTDYRGNRPYSKFNKHTAKYAKGYQGLVQSNIGKKPPEKNFTSQIKGYYQSNRKIHNNNGWRNSTKKEATKIKEETIIISENIQTK